MKTKAAWLATAAALAAGMGSAPGAAAQDNTSEEIIVTARKVSESVQDIPMAISAFSGAQLEERGLDSLTDIARVTPGFSFENFNGAFPTPVIRGQSQTRLTNPVQNVTTYYNGIYLQRGYQVDASLLNLDRVEVLRGPQSAALGRNAFAGAVNFITRTPDDEMDAFISASAGEDDYEKYELSISGPIVEGVLRGIAGFGAGSYDGSWTNNHALANAPGARTKGNLGGYDYENYMLGLNFEPTDNLSFDFAYAGSDRDVEASAGYVIGGGHLEAFNNYNCSPATAALPTTGALNGRNMLFCGTVPVNPVLTAGETRKPGYVVDPRSGASLTNDVISFNADWEISDAFSLSYLFGHAEGSFEGSGASNRNAEVGYTGAGAGPAQLNRLLADNTGNGDIEADSHEARLTYAPSDDLTMYLGLYTSETTDTLFGLSGFWPAQTSGPLLPLIPDPVFAGFIDSQTVTETESVFGFVEYGLGDWTFSLEARQTSEDQAIRDRTFAGVITRSSIGFDNFTSRGTVSYDLSEDNRLYVSVGQGVKSGGFNTGGSNPAGFADPSQATYDPEENITYEFGSRNEFLDGRLVFNGTLYFIDSSDLQVTGARVIGGGGQSTTQTVIVNSGSSETLGLELDARLQATDALSLYGGLGYANAEYGDGTIDQNVRALGLCATNVVCNANGDISGNRIERSPEWTGNVGFSFDHALTSDMDYYVRGVVTYVGEQYVNNVNTAKIDSRVVTDASVGITRGGLEARLSADNLFDEEYIASSFNTQFGTSAFFWVRNIAPFAGERRRVALTLSYRY